MELKKKLEIPGGVGGPQTTLWNGNSRGVEGFKLKNHPWGGIDIFWNHTFSKFEFPVKHDLGLSPPPLTNQVTTTFK